MVNVHVVLRNRVTWPTILVGILLFSSLAKSSQELYEVEMIVFANLDADAIHAELWPLNPGFPNYSQGRRLKTKDGLLAERKQQADSLEATLERDSPINHLLVEEDTPIEQTGFVILPKNRWTLSDAANKLGHQYQLLLHTAWRQPITESAQAIYFQAGKSYNPSETNAEAAYPNFSGTTGAYEFEGLLKLRKGRFIHADIDFVLQEPVKVDSSNMTAASHAVWLLNRDHWRPDTNVQLQSFRVQQSRKMRSKELHYVDHPALGVLIRVAPVEAPKTK